MKKICPISHWEMVKVNNGAHDYCMKEDTRVEGPWEFGTKPVQRNSKLDWAEQFKLAKEGNLEKMDPKILMTHYGNIKRIALDYQPKGAIEREVEKDCRWYWGQPGTGKTRKVIQEDFKGQEVYQKNAKATWDSYQQEKCVLLDDIGKD